MPEQVVTAGPIRRCCTAPIRPGPTNKTGRQVTTTLSAEEAARLEPAIAANRRLHELVKELEALSVADFELNRGK